MKLLSRKEEIILLAVWTLQDNAYGVTIREYIEKSTGVKWVFGAIYSPLGRLVNNGYIESYSSEPIPERGGRSKIMYRLTSRGVDALRAIQEVHNVMWEKIPNLKEQK